MGFQYKQDTNLRLEIEGKEYSVPVDSPEFVAYWRKYASRMDELAKYADYTQAQIEAIPDQEADTVAADSVRMCAEMVVALLGVDAAQEIFNGRERSLLFCMELTNYVYGEIDAQDLAGRITAATRKYSPDEVQGD